MKSSEVTVSWLLEHLEGVEGGDGHWIAWCPVHDDHGTSHKGLSITAPKWPDEKPVLCRCHSPQCAATLPKVVKAVENGHVEVTITRTRKDDNAKEVRHSARLGMEWWVNKTEVPEQLWESLGCFEEGGGVCFTFDDEHMRKVRRSEKEFMWVPSKGITPPLWPKPEDKLPKHIWITEGESDCGTARNAGFHAFAATKGAQTPLPAEAFEALASRGVQEVTICTDRYGEVFAAHLAKAATDAFLTVNIVDFTRVVDPFSGIKDLNDVWVEAGREGEKKRMKLFKDVVERATYRLEEQTPFQTHADAYAVAQEEKHWVIKGLIAPGDKVMIAGPPKSFKTWVGLDLARAMLNGTPFLNRPEFVSEKDLNVLLVEEEGSRHAFAERLARIPEEKGLHWMHRQGIAFTDPASISSLIHSCKKYSIDCVIFDPLQRMIPGVNENDSSETAIVWNEVFRMQMALPNLVVVILHHANKSERLTQESVRGSSRHVGEVDLWILVEKYDKAGVRLTMDGRDVFTDLAPGEALDGTVEIKDDSFKIDTQEFAVRVKQTKVDTNRADILKAIQEGCDTRTKMMKWVGLSDNTVIRYLKELVEDGEVVETKGDDGKPNTYSPTN